MIVAFDEWRPDLAPLNEGSVNTLNVLAAQDGYEVIHSPQLLGFSTLSDLPRLLLVGRTVSGTSLPIVFGRDASYRASGNAFVQCGGSLIGPSDSWVAVPFGNNLYASNGRNVVQRVEVDNLANFVPLELTDGLSARFMASVSQFLMLADIRTNLGNVRFPFRVQWSGLQRPERFDPQPNAIQSDFQDVADIGELRGLTGGEFALILGSKGFTRGDYVGPEPIFRFVTVETNVGCEIPNSVVRTGDVTRWWSKRGWRQSSGEVSQSIGLGKVDMWFRRLFDPSKIERMSTLVLDTHPVVMWSFVSVFSPDGEPDYILAYNWERQRWTYGQIHLQILGQSVAATPFTDDFNLPLPNFNYNTSVTDDYSQLTDTETEIGDFPAAMVDGNLARLVQSGDIQAQLETKEIQLNRDGMTMLQSMLPVVHSATVISGRARARDTQATESYRVKDNLRPEPSGKMSVRLRGRYHIVGVTLSGSFKRALGVDLTGASIGGGR